MRKKNYPPDTGNIIESIYAGIEQPKKQKSVKKARSQKSIKSIEDVSVEKNKNK